MIAERQGALPFPGRNRAAQVFQDGRRIAVRERHRRDGRQAADLGERQTLRRGQPRRGRNIRRGGVARILEHVLHRSALHPGIRAPRTVWILVPLEVPVIRRIGIDDDSGCSPLLRQVHLDPTKVHAVANQNDLARNADVQVLQPLEIFRPAVIRIHSLGGHVTGRGRAIEGRQHPRIILIRIVVDMLASGPGHQNLPFCVGGLEENLLGKIQPRFVRNNLGVEARGFELARHIQGCVVVLFAGGHVGHGSKSLKLFLG